MDAASAAPNPAILVGVVVLVVVILMVLFIDSLRH